MIKRDQTRLDISMNRKFHTLNTKAIGNADSEYEMVNNLYEIVIVCARKVNKFRLLK